MPCKNMYPLISYSWCAPRQSAFHTSPKGTSLVRLQRYEKMATRRYDVTHSYGYKKAPIILIINALLYKKYFKKTYLGTKGLRVDKRKGS